MGPTCTNRAVSHFLFSHGRSHHLGFLVETQLNESDMAARRHQSEDGAFVQEDQEFNRLGVGGVQKIGSSICIVDDVDAMSRHLPAGNGAF